MVLFSLRKKTKIQNVYQQLSCGDSIANTLSKKEMMAEDPKEVIGWKSRLLSIYLPRVKHALKEYKITIIAVNQLRDSLSMSMMPSPVAVKGMKQAETIPGGRTLQFETDQLIYMADSGNIEEKTTGFDGKEVEMYCIKNKAFPPMIKCKTTFSYLGGYSTFWSAFYTLKDEKLIVAGGAYYSMKGYDTKFFAKRVPELYKCDPEFKACFDKLIKDYCKGVVSKYKSQQDSCNIDDMMEKQGATVVNVMTDDQYNDGVVMFDPTTLTLDSESVEEDIEPKSKPAKTTNKAKAVKRSLPLSILMRD